jgi:hypothetical protein
MKKHVTVIAAVIGVLIVLGWNGRSVAETAATSPTTRPADEILPEIPGFTHGKVQRYDDKRLGYAIDYMSEHKLHITLYVYNRGYKLIPEGLSDLARKEAASAKNDVLEVERQGYWKDVKVLREEDIKMGDKGNSPAAAAIYMTLRMPTEKGGSLIDANSDIYVTGHAGQFVKIRCTGPINIKEHEEERKVMLKAVGDAVLR